MEDNLAQLKAQLSQAVRQAANDTLVNDVLFNQHFKEYPEKYKENLLIRSIGIYAIDLAVVSALAQENFQSLAMADTILPELDTRTQTHPPTHHLRLLYLSLHVAYTHLAKGDTLGTSTGSLVADLLVAFSLLRRCEQLTASLVPKHSTHVKPLVFSLVSLARKLSSSVIGKCSIEQQNELTLARWAAALALLFQARCIDPLQKELGPYRTQMLSHVRTTHCLTSPHYF